MWVVSRMSALWWTAAPLSCSAHFFKTQTVPFFFLFFGKVFHHGLFLRCTSAELDLKTWIEKAEEETLANFFVTKDLEEFFFVFHRQNDNKEIFILLTWNITAKLCPDTFNQQSSVKAVMCTTEICLRCPGGHIIGDGGGPSSLTLTPVK